MPLNIALKFEWLMSADHEIDW